MSDGFDKEAERERLREKYAEDEADRQSAKEMSDLLLQGARMTDRHCPECGDPLFEDDGELFCASCERQVVAGGEAPPASSPDAGQPVPGATDGEGTDAEALQTSTNQPSTTEAATPRAHLETALSEAAAAAASANDPRTRKEHLEAATAAIEALRALDGPQDDQSGS